MTQGFSEILGEGRLETQLADGKPLYSKAEARLEASRCLFCYDAPCIQACPTAIDIPKFIKQIASDNIRGSAKTIFESNMLGTSCARVCPVEELCAGDCVYNDLNDTPIAIGRLQRYATDHSLAWEKETGKKLFEKREANGRKVALIGAGPASLACAAHLSLAGVACTIYEQRNLPGGLNTTGVAPYKLHARGSLDEVEWLLSHGAELKTGITVGEDISFEDLRTDYHAVFIGVGLGADRMLDWKGEGVWGATDLIRAIKNEPGFLLDGVGKAVVVGGGNTAIDIARELAMLGVPDVTMAYRREQDVMSGYRHELVAARKYGVKLLTNANPEGVVLENGQASAAKFKHRVSGEEIVLPAQLVVLAVGQGKWTEALGADLALEDNGTVKVDTETRATSLENVYAGGDCINGGKEVVNAAADGRDAAIAMLESWELTL